MTPSGLLRRLMDLATVHLPILLKAEAAFRLPALYDALPLRPSSAWLNPTDNCNMRCIMCTQWRETKAGELSTGEWQGVLRQLKEAGIRSVGFNGGEPLLRRDIAELVSAASALGLAPAIITSGWLLDEERMAALLAAGLRRVTVSVDGVGADYERIRGRDWSRAERACRIAAGRRRAGEVDADIGFVVMRQTLGNLAGVRAFARELGLPLMLSLVDCTPFFFRLPENRAEAESNWPGPADEERLAALRRDLADMKSEDPRSLANSFADLEYLGGYFSSPLQARIPCTVARLRVQIDSRGNVYGGCWSMGPWGSVREKPLAELLASPACRAAHRAMFYKRCPGCSCGFATSVRYSLRMQVRDLLYRLFPPARARLRPTPPRRRRTHDRRDSHDGQGKEPVPKPIP